jgi:hypothetical protein
MINSSSERLGKAILDLRDPVVSPSFILSPSLPRDNDTDLFSINSSHPRPTLRLQNRRN